MVGKVNLYLPGDAEKTDKVNNAYKIISGKSEIGESFRYANEKEVVSSASRDASAGLTAVIAVDSDDYVKVKTLLLKVLSVKVLRSSAVIRNIGIKLIRDSKEHIIHSAVPQGGKIFPSENGLDSAISFKLDKGYIVLLPLGAKELEYAIASGALETESVQKTPREIIADRLDSVRKAGKTMGIADFGLSGAFVAVLDNIGVSKDVFKLSEVSVEGDPEDKEYIANVAKAAKERYDCDYGVAVSETAADGSVSICVADSESAKVEVIHPLEDDTEEKLAKAAAIKLTEMISDAADNGINPPERKSVNNNPTPFYIIIACVVLAVAVCLAIGISVYKKSMKQEETAAEVSNSVVIATVARYTETTTTFNWSYQADSGATGAANYSFTTEGMQIATALANKITNAAASAVSMLNGDKDTIPTNKDGTPSEGKFVFTVYGYGHGVGMSQRGAIALAEKGWTAEQILTYYYRGVTLKVDSHTPKTITKGGEEMTLVAFLCRTVSPEIGPNSPDEAIKAQAIAAYSFARANSFDGQQSFDPSFDYKGTKVERIVFGVLHISNEDEQPYSVYMDYEGKYVNAVYFASAAGKTTSSKTVWGGTSKHYLEGGAPSPEEVEVSKKEFSVEDIKKYVEAYAEANGLEADTSRDPSTWLRIISHDGSLNSAVGYVDCINVCGIAMTGNQFRSDVLGHQLKSHCFTISYVKYK